MALVAGDEARVAPSARPRRRAGHRRRPSPARGPPPVVGSYRVGRFLTNLARRLGVFPVRVATLNAGPALVHRRPGGRVVVSGESRHGALTRIWAQLNPEKVAALDQPLDLR